MPFSRNSDLPENIRNVLPGEAQRIFRSAANSALDNGADESSAMAVGWTAVRKAGFKPGTGGKWVKKWADKVKELRDDADELMGKPHSPAPESSGLTDQRVANYRPANSMERSCAACRFFVAEGFFGGRCTRVAGPIRPDFLCDLFEPAEDISTDETDRTFTMTKIDAPRGLIFGWANVSKGKDGTEVIDAHGDSISPEELEESAYHFVQFFRDGGAMHEGDSKAKLIESMVFTPEKNVALGLKEDALPTGWFVGFALTDDELIQQVAEGQFRAFSIQGAAVSEEVYE